MNKEVIELLRDYASCRTGAEPQDLEDCEIRYALFCDLLDYYDSEMNDEDEFHEVYKPWVIWSQLDCDKTGMYNFTVRVNNQYEGQVCSRSYSDAIDKAVNLLVFCPSILHPCPSANEYQIAPNKT